MITIRPATITDAEFIARIHVDSWRTTYAELLPAEMLANLSVEARTCMWRSAVESDNAQTFLFVAEDVSDATTPQVVGFVSGGPERAGDSVYRGEIYAIYLRQVYQAQGIGRCLVRAGVAYLLQRDLNTLLIWVLEGNPASHFYEALGG